MKEITNISNKVFTLALLWLAIGLLRLLLAQLLLIH